MQTNWFNRPGLLKWNCCSSGHHLSADGGSVREFSLSLVIMFAVFPGALGGFLGLALMNNFSPTSHWTCDDAGLFYSDGNGGDNSTLIVHQALNQCAKKTGSAG